MMKNVNCQQHGIIALSAKGLVGHLGRVCPRLEALREHSDHARCRESDEEGLSGEIEARFALKCAVAQVPCFGIILSSTLVEVVINISDRFGRTANNLI